MRPKYLFVIAFLALLVMAAAQPGTAAELTIGGLYFLGDTKGTIAAGVEQQFGSWGGAAITADGLALTSGDWAVAVGVKAKLSPVLKADVAYAPGLNAPVLSRDTWKNIGAGIVFSPPAAATPALSAEPPPSEVRIGTIPGGYGVSVTRRF